MTAKERQRQEAMILVDSLKHKLVQETDTKTQSKILKELNAARLALTEMESTADEVPCLKCGEAVDLTGIERYSLKVVEVITPPGERDLNRFGDCMRLIYCKMCGPVILEQVVD